MAEAWDPVTFEMGSLPRLRSVAAAAVVALVLACGSGGSSSGGGGSDIGVCVGKGWRDTCHVLLSCSGGDFDLVCYTNHAATENLLEEQGYVLTSDDDTCVCMRDDVVERSVAHDEAFCQTGYDDNDPDRHDKVQAAATAACGWRAR